VERLFAGIVQDYLFVVADDDHLRARRRGTGY